MRRLSTKLRRAASPVTGPALAFALLALLSLGGCATTRSCAGDPRTDSLACASRGLSSGEYERSTADLAHNLADSENRLRTEHRTHERLQARLDALRRQRRKMLASLAELKARIDQLQKAGRTSGTQIAVLRARLENIWARTELALAAKPRDLLKAGVLAKAEASLKQDQSAIALLSRQISALSDGVVVR